MKVVINKKKKCSNCGGGGCGEPYDCHGETYWHSCSGCDGDGFEHIKIYTKQEQAKIDRQNKKEEAEWQSYLKRRASHFDKNKLLKAAKKANFSVDSNLPAGYIRNLLIRNEIIPAVFGIDYP